MATMTFSVTNSGGTVNLSKAFTFADGDLTRLAAWARVAFRDEDGTQPTNQEAWNRLSLKLAREILNEVRKFEGTAAYNAVTISDPT